MDAPVCLEYQVEGDDFLAAGEASNNIKETLKMLGVPSHICRRAAVVTYEVEMNLVIHAGGGLLKASIYPEHLEILAVDRRQGCAWSFSGYESGINACAAPVHGPDTTAIAAISVAGPHQRFERDATLQARVEAEVKRAARDLSTLMGAAA